jgi:glycerophosphoryl diester phosphodiesterase
LQARGLSGVRRAAAAFALPALLCSMTALAFDLQGHRGARGLAPENTLAAFARALSIGVSTLEMDVGVTRDGVMVVHHDRALNPDVARGPDGRWLEARGPALHGLDFAELQRYDVGRLRPGSEYAKPLAAQAPVDGARIPRLADVFALARKAGNDAVRFNIETKLSPQAPDETLPPAEFARALVAEIRKAGVAARATVQSFDWRTLAVVQAEAPDIATVYLSSGKPAAAVLPQVRAAGGRIWSPNAKDVDAAALTLARELGIQVVVWTVNAPEQIAAMLDLGVDGVISDRPDLVREEMQRRGMKLPPPTPVLP